MSNPWKVVDWTTWTEHDERYFKDVRECSKYTDEMDLVEEAIRDCIKENGYSFGGDYHQNGETGMPVLQREGDICLYFFRASMRSWGAIMAETWVGNPGEYMRYYMDVVMPDPIAVPQIKA